ncbi:unnamed protein product [Adineta ricciae]|uniref:Uncharacterized protein n=1 Tax=Adineta ricciae TaxID=249248 RepID=A0A814NYB6_ADIRI|nr:unnamed protein product [Adineta ricciae]CAF1217949.1 unnamed protein product [Adineta ricciae]
MQSIKNVGLGGYGFDPNILATSGFASCIAVVIELENTIFFYYADSVAFNASRQYSKDDGNNFLTKIFRKVRFNDDNYSTFRIQIDEIREQHSLTTHEGDTTLHNSSFHLFILAIRLNLIGFNLPPITPHGTKKIGHEDDNLNDFIMDSTVVFDRSSSPSRFLIYQFGGREFKMHSTRSESLLLGIDDIDTISLTIKEFVWSKTSSYHMEFLNQISSNVKDPSHLYESIDKITKQEELNPGYYGTVGSGRKFKRRFQSFPDRFLQTSSWKRPGTCRSLLESAKTVPEPTQISTDPVAGMIDLG